MIKQSWPTLYKLTATGKIQTWAIVAKHIDTASYPYYQYTYGQKDGKLQTYNTIIKEGKNIGKANETTSWEQCCLEAESLWRKQQDRKGYTQTIPTEKKLRPMLAKSYDKAGNHIDFPCFVSAKLDGCRCLVYKDSGKIKYMSRQGKEFKTLQHLDKYLDWLPNDIVLDGELYNHNIDFQTIISAIKRDKPSDKSHLIQYHVYDVVMKVGYSYRYQWLRHNIPRGSSHVKIVHSGSIERKEHVWTYHSKFTKQGYEGAMLRNYSGEYMIDRRSKDLQKVKKFMDMEFPIVGAEQNKGKMANQCSFICETKEGKRFKVKPQGDETIREKYWEDWKAGKLNGKMLTVKFFSWTDSEQPVPRFPIGIIIRTYED